MRWFVDISSIGSGGGNASRYCVEAEQWQRALQSVRALRGDTSPFANFSIELLEDGYRAIDPATRSRYVVQKAPDDSELTTKPIEVPVVPSVPPPAPSRPRGRSEARSGTDTPRPRSSERTRRGRLSIPDDPVPRQPPPPVASAIPIGGPLPVSSGVASSTSGSSQPPGEPLKLTPPPSASPPPATPPTASASAPPERRSTPAPAPKAESSEVVTNGTGAPHRSSTPAPAPNAPIARPMQAETAFERMTAGFASFPVAAQAQGATPISDGAAGTSTTAKIDVTTEILPRFRILSERSDSPTASSPLSYREMAFSVSETTSYSDAEAIVRSQFEVVRASLRHAPKGQFITLAVFDHEFTAKPRRLPLATLSFKDWRDAEPVVRFPLKDARSSTQAPAPSTPPPSSGPRPDQMAQTMLVPAVVSIDAKRSDSALPKVETDQAPPPSKRKPPTPTPSQIRRAAVEMGSDDLTDVIRDAPPRVEVRAIPDPPESLTQVMPAPVHTSTPATTPTPLDVSDEALSDAPTPAIEAGRTYSVGSATDRGVFPTVTLPSGVDPLPSKSSPPPAQTANAYGVTAPAEPLSSAMRTSASEPPRATTSPSNAPPAQGVAAGFPAVDQSTRASSPAVATPSVASPAVVAAPSQPPPANPAMSQPPPAKSPSHPPPANSPSHPPPANYPSQPPPGYSASQPPAGYSASQPPAGFSTQSQPPQSLPPQSIRVRGDELISELFEALSDLAFLSDPLEGADFVLGVALEKLPSALGFVSFFSLDSREFVVVRVSQGAAPGLVLKRAGERAGLATRAMRANQAVVLTDGAADAVADDPRWGASGVSPTTLICAPVKLGGRYLGLIELANPVDGVPYTSGDGHAVSYIAQQFAEFLAQRDVVLDPERITAPKLSARVRR